MKTVADIMTKDVLTVLPDTPISIAIKVLVIRKITGLPVVDDSKKLIGVISEKDLLGLLVADQDMTDKTVSDFMTTGVKSFSPDDSAESICKFLMENTFRRVPIVQDDKLVGIVSRRDIISLVWKEHYEGKA